jgi:hypothetical protein
MKKDYRIKKSISIRQFISEFGEGFSEHIKEKLLQLEERSFLTRKVDNCKLDLKHVEHPLYDCACDLENSTRTGKKEYTFAQFIIHNDSLYFSDSCLEGDEIMQAPVISTIFNSLDNQDMICEAGSTGKKVTDDNIDFIVDSLLDACPQVSQGYLDIIKGMRSRSQSK